MNPPRGLGKKTAQMRETIARRYAEGASLRQIGVEMGRTWPGILYHLKAMDVPRRPAHYHRRTDA